MLLIALLPSLLVSSTSLSPLFLQNKSDNERSGGDGVTGGGEG